MEIKAEVKRIEALKDFFFLVPDYQREYVWEGDSHVSRFLQDIYDEFDPNREEQTNYFIGSAIIVKRKDGQYDVIDGQQRLTTIIIALCSMRNTLSLVQNLNDLGLQETKEELIQIIKDLLYKYSIHHGKRTPRLVLQYEENKDFLLQLIEGTEYVDHKTNSIRRMQNAYNTVLSFLKELFENTISVAINFIKYFLINVEMVVIQPDGIGSALKIFETINERGVGLNAMDLLKNLLFSNAKEGDFEKIKEIWKQVVQHLSNCGEADKPLRFLRYFLIARYHDGVIREDEIYKWIISNEGKEKTKYEANPIGFAKEILRAAEKYSAFIKATSSSTEDANFPFVTGIGYLSKKNSRQHIILLLALKDGLDKQAINLLAKNIEVLAFYYAILKVLTKYYEAVFAGWAIKIRSFNAYEELNKFIDREMQMEVSKYRLQFESSFDYKTQNDVQPQYRIKYILGRIENYIRAQVHFSGQNFLFYQNQQLEHILPQEGKNIPEEKFRDKHAYQDTVVKIGNLTLLEQPINGSINFFNDISTDNWFERKKQEYQKSAILLTKTLAGVTIGLDTAYNQFANTNLKSFDNWGENEVKERQQFLKKLMLRIWTLETVTDEQLNHVNFADNHFSSLFKPIRTSAPKQGLSVEFSDGKTIAEKHAYETFIQTIKEIGYENVEKLNLEHCRVPIVSREKDSRYGSRQFEIVPNVYIMHHSSTEEKKRILEKISSTLNLNLKVKLV